MPRGGRRPGSGAPRGNMNRLRHGRRSRDPNLRHLVAAWAANGEPVAHAIAYMKALADGRRPIPPPAPPDLPSNVHPIWGGPPLPSSSPASTQSNAQGAGGGAQPHRPATEILDSLALRLTSFGFRGAAAFVRQHFRAADTLAAIIDDVAAMPPADFQSLRNPPGLIRAAIHDELAPDGHCPHCGWTRQAAPAAAIQ